MTTQQMVINRFGLFCKLYNLKTSAAILEDKTSKDFYSNHFVTLDFSSTYGGYRIDIIHTNTSESFFDKKDRLKANEMICYLDGLIAAKNTSLFNSSIINEVAELA